MNSKVKEKYTKDSLNIMLRTLFIEKGKSTKTNNFKLLNIGNIVLKIVKLKVWLMAVPLIEVSYLL